MEPKKEGPTPRPNELLRRMGVEKPEDVGITDERLKGFVGIVGKLDPRLVKSEDIRLKSLSLTKIQEDAVLGTTPGIKPFKDGELDTVQAYLNDWYADLAEKEAGRIESSTVSSSRKTEEAPTPAGFVKELAEAIHGKHLSQDEKYLKMQDDEQWNNNPIQPINPDAAPGYYVDMTETERQLHEIRVELNNACYLKRNKGFTLETLSKEVPYAGLSKTETRMLYEGTPGLKQAVKLYIQLIDGTGLSSSGKELSMLLLSAKGRDDLLVVRGNIRDAIEGVVASSVADRSILEIKCRDAEQIAFNLLFLGNTFESLDSQWNNGQRDRAPQMTSEVLTIPIRNAMKPLDSLIASLGKAPEKFASVGAFGNWAYNQIRRANRDNAVDLKQITKVKIVPERKGEQNKFWTLGDKGKTLYVPECYPRKMIGSIWEETKAKIGGEETPLLELIRRSGDGSIPWDNVEGEDMWGTYGFRLGKAAVIWDLLQGKNLIKFGDDDQVRQWVDVVNGALSQFGLVSETSIKRWLLYASSGINQKERSSKLANSNLRLFIRRQLGPKRTNYLPENELLFPWDYGIIDNLV